MHFHVLTLFPEMIQQGMSESITGRAMKQGILQLDATNIRDFSNDKHGRVDDYTYGGGAGMLMQAQPVFDAWNKVATPITGKKRTIYVTPQGRQFNQKIAKELSEYEDLIFLCGHYEGIDERVLEEVVDDYISIGDYVLTGGELASMVMMDAIARLVPGVLNNEESAETESFAGELLEYPQYSRPRVWHEKEVPEVLLSGNMKKIRAYRLKESIQRTKSRRPDLYEKYEKLEAVKEVLLKEKRLHIDMIELINRGRAELVYAKEKEYLLRDIATGIGYHTKLDAGQTKLTLDGFSCVVAHQKQSADVFTSNTDWQITNPCYQALYTQKEKMAITGLYHADGSENEKGMCIRPLGMEHLQTVLDWYHLFKDEAYMKGRIASGSMFGAFVHKELAAFIGIHEDGSIGMLEVAPQYRRQHMALALETYMINYHVERGMIPYGQVIFDNEESIKVQERLGIHLSKDLIYWMRK